MFPPCCSRRYSCRHSGHTHPAPFVAVTVVVTVVSTVLPSSSQLCSYILVCVHAFIHKSTHRCRRFFVVTSATSRRSLWDAAAADGSWNAAAGDGSARPPSRELTYIWSIFLVIVLSCLVMSCSVSPWWDAYHSVPYRAMS